MDRRWEKALMLALVVVTSASVAFPQSLADAAKKEQARRKKVAPAQATKVYTETDLPPSEARGAETNTAAGAASDPPQPSAPSPADKNVDSRAAGEALRRSIEADYKQQEDRINGRIAKAEAEVQRLGNHPTGGGSVCRVPADIPPGTAPHQVVCPYQMESRYEVAKRALEEIKAELASLREQARREGVVVRR